MLVCFKSAGILSTSEEPKNAHCLDIKSEGKNVHFVSPHCNSNVGAKTTKLYLSSVLKFQIGEIG
jgi:hypothetical protein